jgi:predicted acyl esterase
MRLESMVQFDTPDFDLWSQVLMVLPDGSTIRFGEDIRRACFRNSQFKEELLKPNQIVEMAFEFPWTAWRIPKGSRLRLTIAPLHSPSYQKNYNTGGKVGYEKIGDARMAHISLFHDSRHPSFLTLPFAASVRAAANR